eukprot:g4852.t1
MIAASWFGRFNKWWGSKYVYFVMIVLLLIEIQIWLTQGQASVSEQRRLELDLPSIWICPRNEDVVPAIKRCEFESVSHGGVHPCSTMERVKFANVFGLNCAVVSNVDGSPMKVRSEKDALLLEIELIPISSEADIETGNEEDGGVVVVIGRDEMFGNQWFFAKKGDFTAVLLSRTERYEYTSPVGSEVFHDYNIYTSSLKLRPSRNNIYTWPPLQNQMLRVGGGKYDGGEKIVDMKNRVALQVMYRSMLIKVSKVAFKYPPIADFARVFGPIGGLIGLYKAIQDYMKRRRKGRRRNSSDSGIGMIPK